MVVPKHCVRRCQPTFTTCRLVVVFENLHTHKHIRNSYTNSYSIYTNSNSYSIRNSYTNSNGYSDSYSL